MSKCAGDADGFSTRGSTRGEIFAARGEGFDEMGRGGAFLVERFLGRSA